MFSERHLLAFRGAFIDEIQQVFGFVARDKRGRRE